MIAIPLSTLEAPRLSDPTYLTPVKFFARLGRPSEELINAAASRYSVSRRHIPTRGRPGHHVACRTYRQGRLHRVYRQLQAALLGERGQVDRGKVGAFWWLCRLAIGRGAHESMISSAYALLD